MPAVWTARLALPLMLVLAACQPQQARPLSESVSGDSVRGVVSITGTSFEKFIDLRRESGSIRLTSGKRDSSALSRIGGVEIVARGKPQGRTFAVESFSVVAVDGQPVVDGIIRNVLGALTLETPTAFLKLGNPPVALRSMEGARVWIGGSLATGPNRYGVIQPAGN